jgi:tRNA-2-methylthio-N6-dimethylallyladenosine synthase
MSNGKIANFASLIEYISEIEEVKRIRFTTSHPNEMNDHLIDCFGNIKKLANHLHLPIQSGSDKVLMAMKRNYTTLEYKSIIKKLRKKLPNVSLTTDLIIGFPTETTNDFNLTKKLFTELDFDYSFSFIYSKRPGTPAAYLKDETTNEEKLERLHEIQSINIIQGEHYTKKMIGTTQRVLIDHFSKKKAGVLLGKTDNNRIIEFKESKGLLNKFVNVKVMKILGKSLVGELV